MNKLMPHLITINYAWYFKKIAESYKHPLDLKNEA